MPCPHWVIHHVHTSLGNQAQLAKVASGCALEQRTVELPWLTLTDSLVIDFRVVSRRNDGRTLATMHINYWMVESILLEIVRISESQRSSETNGDRLKFDGREKLQGVIKFE
jgi:hypothetical protein